MTKSKKSSHFSWILASLLLPLWLVAGPSEALDFVFIETPGFQDLAIRQLSHGGNGCPQDGQVYAGLKDRLYRGRAVLDLTLSQDIFVERRSACQLTLVLDHPKGMTFGVKKTRLSGEAALSQGAKASISTHTYFQGQSQENIFEGVFPDNFYGSWSLEARAENDEIIWAPCNKERALNVKIAATVSASAYVPGVVIDRQISFQLYWKSCD